MYKYGVGLETLPSKLPRQLQYCILAVLSFSPLPCRALREVLMPTSGPSQTKIHKISAAHIMKAFDREHPDNGILDTDTVNVLSRRYVCVRESSFLAGELRQLNRHNELVLLVASLSKDKKVLSSKLDPAPIAPRESTPESAAAARAVLDAGVVETKRLRLRSKGPRSVVCNDGTSWLLPWGVICEEKDGRWRRLLVKFLISSCQVNGRSVGRAVAIRHAATEINKHVILALR